MTLPSSVTETPETDSDRVSECPMCGQREFLRVIESPPLEQESEPWGFHVICSARGLYTVGYKPTHPVGCGTAGGWGETVSDAIAAWNRRPTPSLPPRSGGVALTDYEIQVLIGTTVSGRNMPPDDTFNLPAAWKNLHKLGLIDRADGLAIATKAGSAIVERIRSTLADPIPEAPADEEVGGLAQALRNLAEGAEQEDRTILYKAAAALRRSTETDSPVSKHDVLLAAAKHDLAYSEGFVSGWNSGLKTVSPDASDRARGHAASRAAERMGEDARAVIRVARSRSTETDKAVPAPATGGEDDEMYEIGKRDGYEEAVQDIDLLTGGDGEYRVSVFLEGGVDDDRHCPDPAAMKARIAERFAALRRPETDKPGVREALEALRPFAETFAKADDPGVSDLYDEQPFSLHVPLGAWRRARSAWRKLAAPLGLDALKPNLVTDADELPQCADIDSRQPENNLNVAPAQVVNPVGGVEQPVNDVLFHEDAPPADVEREYVDGFPISSPGGRV